MGGFCTGFSGVVYPFSYEPVCSCMIIQVPNTKNIHKHHPMSFTCSDLSACVQLANVPHFN